MNTYAWKPLSMIHADAQAAGELCERLAKEDRLTPENLLNESRPEDAPLHDEFEWDDSKAAEGYRLNQAAHIIRAIVISPKEEELVEVRAFVRVTEEKAHYTSINVVLGDEQMTETLLNDAIQDYRCWWRKYRNLLQLAPINDAAQLVIEHLGFEAEEQETS